MTFIIGASAHGSPGVSTALQVMAAQWPNPDAVPVVVEADAGGGVVAARFDITITPGMVTLAESLRKFESPPLLDHAQRLPSGVACVPLSPSASAAAAQLRSAGGFLGPYLRSSGHPVLLDAGTVLPDSRLASVMTDADLLLWFVRPNREELLVLKHRIAETPQPDNVAVVLVGDLPYNAGQVSEALDIEVVHVLPLDPRAATAVNIGGDDRYLRRSPFARSCAQLTDQMQHELWVDAVKAPDYSHLPPPPAAVPSDEERQRAYDEADITNELPSRQVVADLSHLPPPPEPPAEVVDVTEATEPPEAVEEDPVIVWRPSTEVEQPVGAPSEPQPVVWFPDGD